MYFSKFAGLAELEALRAGLKPSVVRFPHRTLQPARPAPVDAIAPSAADEGSIRAEMERRLEARLARVGREEPRRVA